MNNGRPKAKLTARVCRFGPLSTAALLRPLAEQLVSRAALRPGQSVVDVLADGGELTVALAHAVTSAGAVAAVEDDPTRVRALRDRLAEAHIDAQVIEAPATRLPFDDGELDVAASLLTLAFSADLSGALREMRRVAARAAVVLIEPGGAPHHDALEAAWREVMGACPADLRLSPTPPPSEDGWTVHPLQEVARFDSVEHSWRSLTEQHDVGLDRSAHDDIVALMSERLSAWTAADGTLRIPVRAVLWSCD